MDFFLAKVRYNSIFVIKYAGLINLFKYQTPSKYALAFKEIYSSVNLKQVKMLSTAMFMLSVCVRITSLFFSEELRQVPNIMEYNISNLTQLSAYFCFIVLSTIAIRSKNWTITQRNLLTLAFTAFLLGITFFISYIYSQHNTRNTLTVFLMGVVMVSIFFSLELKYIATLAVFVVLLFVIGMVVPSLSPIQGLFNVIAGVILAFVLYVCSRYSYFFKSQHFIQLKQLEEKNEEINNLNRLKGEILAFVAHDLRTPLNNIEALSGIIIEEEGGNPRPEMQMILSAAIHAKHIINDLIEVVQEDRKPLQVQKTEMISYLERICASWQSNADQPRKVELSSNEKSIVVSINAPKFTRVLDNLIGNGIKFSPPNSQIQISASASKELCTIQIKDFGIGIPEHLQGMLFDQFSKAGRPGLRGEKSIGLGLHISRQIVEQHGGRLTVESKENEGTAFTILIPVLT
jgi:two-component system sensor histidine kinase VicK